MRRGNTATVKRIVKVVGQEDFDSTGGMQEYIVPITGIYKLEVWGAERRKWLYICNVSSS